MTITGTAAFVAPKGGTARYGNGVYGSGVYGGSGTSVVNLSLGGTVFSFVATGSVARHKMGIAASGKNVGPDLRNNFSGLTNGTTPTTGNSGGVSGSAFNSVFVPTAGVVVADNTHLGLDAMALKVATTTTAASPLVQWNLTSLGYARTKLYFRVDSLIPAAATPAFRPIAFRTTAGTHIFSLLVSGNAISSSYGSGFSGLSGFTGAIANNAYFRVEGILDTVAGTVHLERYTGQKDAYPDQVKDYTGVVFGNVIQRIDIGNANSATNDGPFWIDEVGVSETGPLSPPSVKRHKMGIAASGGEKESGTGSVARHKMDLSSAGAENFSSGSVRMYKMGLAEAGTERFTSTASVAMHKMGLSESGVETFFAVGEVRAPKMGLAATATIRLSFHLSGGVAMHKIVVQGQRQPIDPASLFIFSPV